jgi:DHA1 family inner membrane transport protein
MEPSFTAGPASAATSPEGSPGRERRAQRPSAGLLAVIACWGYASGVNGSIAPFLAADFGLGDAGIARLYAWIGLASLASLPIGAAVDRFGRRRALLTGCALLPLAALASAAAPSPRAYLGAQLVAYAIGASLLATASVVVAEQLSPSERARGHGVAGIVFTCATAAPLLLAATLSALPQAWRWVWAAAAAPLVALPWLARHLSETEPWRVAAACGETGRVRIADVFAAPCRARALAVIVAVVCVSAVESATRTWLLYHQVRGLGESPALATAVLVLGGGVGLTGYAIGSRLADAWGRRAAFAAAASVFALAVLGYYAFAGTLTAGRLPVVALSMVGLSGAGGAALVAFRAAATELFPTALRGTLGGFLAVGSAAGWWLAMQTVSVLSGPLGGIGPAIAALAATALPIAAACLFLVPETSGAELDGAALSAPR